MLLTGLAVHPVKSTAIRPVRSARVLLGGLEGDRTWVVVDADGVIVTAREAHSLFTIAADLAGDRRLQLVDVRAPERYSGEAEAIDPVAGHIPGAVNLPSVGNLAADGRFLDGSVIARRFTAAGVQADAVLYCGSGITAAHTLLALESAGLTGAIYPGSWSEWITDPSRPVATGSA